MSPHDDLLGDRIRTTLRTAPVALSGPGEVLPIVVGRASRRRRFRYLVGATGSVAALGVLAVSLALVQEPDVAVRTDTATTGTTGPTPTYGFAPVTPLVDGPLRDIPQTEITSLRDLVFSVNSTAGVLGLSLRDAEQGGSLWGEAERMTALTWAGSGSSPDFPDRGEFIYGVTRPEVHRIEWTVPGAGGEVQTVSVGSVPELRFFLIEVPPHTFDPDSNLILPELAAFGADGTLLTDFARIKAEEGAFEIAADRRMGVEAKVAAVRDARVSADGQSIALTIFACGEEPHVSWTVDGQALRIAATVKRLYAEGDCLTGDIYDLSIGLNEPYAGQSIIDDRTGAPITVLPTE